MRRVVAPAALLLVTGAVPVAAAVSAPGAQPTAVDVPPVVALAQPVTDLVLDPARRAVAAPLRYVGSRVDTAAVLDRLETAPDTGAVRVSLPAPDGRSVQFDVAEDSVLEDDLQARHPELRTYAGRGVTDPTDTIRFSVTPMGLSAVVRNAGLARTWYVDPAYRGRGTTAHVSYLGRDLPRPAALRFDEGEVEETHDAPALADGAAARAGEAVVQRTYRMAFVTTPSYAADFGTANVLAEKVRVVNRANAIYMDDVAVKFVLVNGTEQLNLDTVEKATGADGPCGANPCFAADEIAACGGNGIDRNNFVAGQIIGADAFDIGHLGSGEGSGGVAYLGVVGGENKAGGCTALDEPRGDFYAVDFFAHEVGHQMGGNHTFDGLNGSCVATNRQSTTSVEPGSGSTVMAYAGICGSDDLQPHTDPYFSQRSIDEFTAVTTAAPEQLTEQQVVNLRGFDGTDSFQLTYLGKPAQTITNGTTYTVAGLEAALLLLTGKPAQVTPYDGAQDLTTAGFTVDFPDTAAYQRLGVAAGTGGTTGFTGVLQDGGPATNQGTAATVANRRPTVDAGPDKAVPILTPFVLTATGSDPDAGETAGLTYLWEQNDEGPLGLPVLGLGPGQPLVGTRTLGPLFRVFGSYAAVSATDTLLYSSPGQNLAPAGARSRSFPDLAQVVAGTTNAEDPLGSCPAYTGALDTTVPPGAALDCYSEQLPTALYALNPLAGEMNFRVTARDGNPRGGGTAHDDLTLTLDPTVGPFAVTSRDAAGASARARGTETVTWDVNGTDSATYATQVSISLSTDGGKTFPFPLASSTANDGEAEVTLPDVNTSKARILVKAVGNYFYDTSDVDFTIAGATPPAATPAPRTRITAGPGPRSFVVGDRVSFRAASSLAGSTFTCRIDRRAVPCADGVVALSGLRAGTHVFTVAATSPAGRVDPTPDRRAFAVVGDERAARRSAGWRAVAKDDAYRGTLLTTSRPGRTLTFRLQRASRFTVLLRRTPTSGRVAIVLDGKVLKTLSLRGTGTRRADSRSFATPQGGTVVVRSLDRKRVDVDGFGTFVIPPRR
ncbi:M12 family metallo-peptidase [Nocardioides litoris]|uniref:M12 family metallo-peptidase n=1 Tax=Nocardioides litoris TaxID=1926648 RepID=UPI00111E76DC|nr:M12 family metallo-peptidase [Nocardioides litoris]